MGKTSGLLLHQFQLHLGLESQSHGVPAQCWRPLLVPSSTVDGGGAQPKSFLLFENARQARVVSKCGEKGVGRVDHSSGFSRVPVSAFSSG